MDRVETGTFSYTGDLLSWSKEGVGVVACKPSIVTDPDCPSPSRSKAAAVGLDP